MTRSIIPKQIRFANFEGSYDYDEMSRVLKSQKILKIVLPFLRFFGFTFGLLAGLPATYGQSLLINIDNPQFRKMVFAAPDFTLAKGTETSEIAVAYKDQGAQELRYLLEYTGLFSQLNSSGYKSIIASAQSKGVLDYGEQLYLPQWKAIGTEALTTGQLILEGTELKLELRTYDLQRGTLVLGKRYGKVTKEEIKTVVRRYANLLMETYTGRPGIFSSKITFIGKRHAQDVKQVYVCDFDGSNVTQITKTNATKISANWSPDGRYITYTSFEKGNPDLYMIELPSMHKQVISNYKGINSGAQWAPNGKVLAYSGSENGDTDIFILDPFRGVRKKLIRGSGLDVDPTFSPDGKMLAFVSGRFGNPHIFVSTLEWADTNNVKVTGDTRLTYAGWYNSTPAWSPDSSKIVFAGYDKDIDRYDIFLMNPNGKELERLTLKTGDNESPSFSPNGLMVVFQSNRIGESNAKGRPQLWMMNRDGSGQRLINTGLYEAQTPSWSHKLYE